MTSEQDNYIATQGRRYESTMHVSNVYNLKLMVLMLIYFSNCPTLKFCCLSKLVPCRWARSITRLLYLY